MPDERVLLELGWKYLPEDGQLVMEILLCRGGLENFEIVQARILGAIDRAWFANKVSDEEAREAYFLLGFDPEVARQIRQETAKFTFNRPTRM